MVDVRTSCVVLGEDGNRDAREQDPRRHTRSGDECQLERGGCADYTGGRRKTRGMRSAIGMIGRVRWDGRRSLLGLRVESCQPVFTTVLENRAGFWFLCSTAVDQRLQNAAMYGLTQSAALSLSPQSITA